MFRNDVARGGLGGRGRGRDHRPEHQGVTDKQSHPPTRKPGGRRQHAYEPATGRPQREAERRHFVEHVGDPLHGGCQSTEPHTTTTYAVGCVVLRRTATGCCGLRRTLDVQAMDIQRTSAASEVIPLLRAAAVAAGTSHGGTGGPGWIRRRRAVVGSRREGVTAAIGSCRQPSRKTVGRAPRARRRGAPTDARDVLRQMGSPSGPWRCVVLGAASPPTHGGGVPVRGPASRPFSCRRHRDGKGVVGKWTSGDAGGSLGGVS